MLNTFLYTVGIVVTLWQSAAVLPKLSHRHNKNPQKKKKKTKQTHDTYSEFNRQRIKIRITTFITSSTDDFSGASYVITLSSLRGDVAYTRQLYTTPLLQRVLNNNNNNNANLRSFSKRFRCNDVTARVAAVNEFLEIVLAKAARFARARIRNGRGAKIQFEFRSRTPDNGVRQRVINPGTGARLKFKRRSRAGRKTPKSNSPRQRNAIDADVRFIRIYDVQYNIMTRINYIRVHDCGSVRLVISPLLSEL